MCLQIQYLLLFWYREQCFTTSHYMLLGEIYITFFFFAHYQSSVTVWPLQGPRALMPSPVLVAQVAGSD